MEVKSSNRPWPVPREPWIMLQKWHNLLFSHWPVPVETLRPLVPDVFPLDTFDGYAWIAVTPFTLGGLRARMTPPVPGVSSFPEINVRTYVTLGGKPGVYFFSLDAGSRLAVLGARLSYGLPYFFANANASPARDSFEYRSVRSDRRGRPATFRAKYRPTSSPFQATPGTFEYFLTERYALYTVRAGNTVWRAEIDHIPWPLQTAEAEIQDNTMPAAARIQLPAQEPVLHFSRFIDVQVWRPTRVPDHELTGRRSI